MVTRKNVLSRLQTLFLLLGCGSLLTLVSCAYVRESNPMPLDVVPTASEGRLFGFPLPCFASFAEWWEDQHIMDYSAIFVWEGALLDLLFYALILWFGYSLLSRAIQARSGS
jgi:hypothetical protein